LFVFLIKIPESYLLKSLLVIFWSMVGCRANSALPAVFLNKVLSKLSHAHSFMDGLWLVYGIKVLLTCATAATETI
jgi:hypothetical protein